MAIQIQPLDLGSVYGTVAAIQGNQQRNRLLDLQTQAYQDQVDTRNRLNPLLAQLDLGAGYDANAGTLKQIGAVDPTTALEYAKVFQTYDTNKAAVAKQHFDTAQQGLAGILSLPADQRPAAYAQLVPQLEQLGVDPKMLPPQWSDAMGNAALANISTAADILKQVHPDAYTLTPGSVRYGPDNKPVAENPRAPTSTGARYYAVPTGNGVLVFDKETGMAQAMGADTQGNLVPLGQPFMPMMGGNGQPTGFAQPTTAAPTTTTPPDATTPPAATSPSPTSGASPVMPPSLAAPQQQDVSRAKALGTAEGNAAGQSVLGQQDKAAAEMALSSSEARLSAAEENLQQALDYSNKAGSPLAIKTALLYPGESAAKNFLSVLNSVHSDIVNNVIQNFKQSTQEGQASGVGRVMQAEIALWQDAYAAVSADQSADLRATNIKRLMEITKQLRKASQDYYAQGFGLAPSGDQTTAPASGGGSPGESDPLGLFQ